MKDIIIMVMRAFVRLKQMITTHKEPARKIDRQAGTSADRHHSWAQDWRRTIFCKLFYRFFLL